MHQEQVTIRAKDGDCKAYVLAPEGQGPWPGVIFYMDAFGIRPGDGADGHPHRQPGLRRPPS